MAKRSPKKPKSAAPASAEPESAHELAHRLHALLHTIRSIAQHEDQLCTLLHAAQHGSLTPELRQELHTALEQMPDGQYDNDRAAVERALQETGAA